MKLKLLSCSFLVLLSAFVIGCNSNEPTIATEGMTESDFAEYEAALEAATGGMEEEETGLEK